jgi:hypothetical protein
MSAIIKTVERLVREACEHGLKTEKYVFERVKKRLAETVDTDSMRKNCVRASSMPPSVRAAVRGAFAAALRAKKKRARNEARNVPFVNGPKQCKNAGCSATATTPNSFATHASRCTCRKH